MPVNYEEVFTDTLAAELEQFTGSDVLDAIGELPVEDLTAILTVYRDPELPPVGKAAAIGSLIMRGITTYLHQLTELHMPDLDVLDREQREAELEYAADCRREEQFLREHP